MKKITFANTAVIDTYGKIRMETTKGGQIRVKPTNRVKSKDLSDLTGADAIIPLRYFEQAKLAGNTMFDAALTEPATFGLEKQAHGWYQIVPAVAEGMDSVTLVDHEEPAVEAPATSEQAPVAEEQTA